MGTMNVCKIHPVVIEIFQSGGPRCYEAKINKKTCCKCSSVSEYGLVPVAVEANTLFVN